MENNDINQLLDSIIKRNQKNIMENNGEIGTLDQARQLLNTWANQTNTFNSRQSKTEKQSNKKQKIVKYRKLDAPMMVVRKEMNRPSVDPTLIMEARLAHVREMKARRLERMENNQSDASSVQSQSSTISQVAIPDIDSEIRSYRMKVNERMKEKQRELDERAKRNEKNKIIDENVQLTLAQEKLLNSKTTLKDKSIIKQQVDRFAQSQNLHKKKVWFSVWVSECTFQSQSYNKAAKLNNYRRKVSAFSVWKNKLRRKQQEREVTILERQLRKEKQLESTADKIYRNSLVKNSYLSWKIKYRTSNERKIIENQHERRRNLIVSKIKFDEQNPNPSKIIISKPEPICTKEPEKHISNPKTKIAKIKVNPKFEAMTKRMEEQHAKKLQKAQKEAEENATKEEQNFKEKMELQRKKKEEHRLFLEQEKIKREEIKKKQQHYQEIANRKKYCERVSQEFRLRKLKQIQFEHWKNILVMRANYEEQAHNHYLNRLKQVALRGIMLYSMKQKQQRNDTLEKQYQLFKVRNIFSHWKRLYERYQDCDEQTRHICDIWIMRKAFNMLCDQKKRQRKAKHVKAVMHANKALLRRFFALWPIGCQNLHDDEERESNRQGLMSKALQFLNEIDSDDLYD